MVIINELQVAVVACIILVTLVTKISLGLGLMTGLLVVRIEDFITVFDNRFWLFLFAFQFHTPQW